jgi:hypothetical protein
VIVFFRNNDDNIRDIKAVTSIDRGASFTDWISVDDHNWYIEGCPSTGPDAHFLGDSKFVAVYKTEVSGEGKVFLNVYDLETDASTDLVEIYATSGTASNTNYPQVCYDDGLIGLVWEDGSDGTSLDVFFNSSVSGSIDFNPDNALNLTAIAAVQAKPDITLDNGIFHVVYADAADFSVNYLQIAEANSIDELPTDFAPTVLSTKNQIIIRQQEQLELKLVITDLNGRLVFQQTSADHEIVVNTGDWQSGMYIIQLSSGDQTVVKKLIK